MEAQKMTPKKFLMNVLNGVAIGDVVVLVPGALLGELFKALLPVFPQGQFILNATNLAISMMSIVVGVIVAILFKLTPIQIASVGLAAFVGSGVAKVGENGAFILQGTGDVINMAITAAIAVGLVLLFGNRFKAYTILLVPTLVLIIGGGLGVLILPFVAQLTTFIGLGIAQLTTLQPIVMSVLMAVIFAMLIVSPISTVGIALAISLSGIGSGAANLGIVAAGFGLAIAGWRANSFGTSIAHFVGSPKIQLANVMSKPQIMAPILCNAAVLGVLAAIFNIQGTAMSAGFGFSGLIGPVNALNLMDGGWSFGNIIIIISLFVVAPITLGLFFDSIFKKRIPIVRVEDYKLDYN